MRIVMVGVGILAASVLGCGSDPEIGPVGARGPDGAVGTQGPAGVPGAVGTQGPAGKDGDGGPTSGSRLKVRYRLGEDGSREPIPGAWWDSQLQVECSFQRASDGVERCLPLPLKFPTKFDYEYLDAVCTNKVLVYFAPSQGCTSDVATSSASIVDASCGTFARAYPIGDPVSDPATVLYAKTPMGCGVGSPMGEGLVVRAIGAEIPAASFISATGTHD